MIFQTITELDTIIAIALTLVFTLLLTALTYKNSHSFFCYSLFFISFFVWAELLPFWVMILNFIAVLISSTIVIKNKYGGKL